MTFLRTSSLLSFFSLFILFPILPLCAHAQTAATTDACSDTTNYLPNETTAERQARLTQDAAGCAAEVAAAQAQLTTAQDQSKSLQSDVNVLTAQINAAQLKIKQENLIIQSLGQNISQKTDTINTLQGQIDQGHQTLAQILVKIDETDDVTVPELILGSDTLSDIVAGFDNFQSIQTALALTFSQLEASESQNQSEKDDLTTQQNQEEDAEAVIQQQQATVQAAQAQKKQLLAVSQESESAYSQLVAQKQEKVAEIKAALFNLAGGTTAIPFGDAYNYATTVYQVTGVPQNFLLAILTQETGIGKNVGTCHLTDTTDGSGVDDNGNPIANVMKPSRDVQPFIAITSSLGLDYKSLPVSCPQSIGYGGAMGPAQFIASTWSLLIARLQTALGISTPPNPWTPLDAFMAAGLYLSDLGAGSSSYTAERTAACRYYSGTTCYDSEGDPNVGLSYGSNVMSLAASIQTNQIDPLQGL